MGHVQREIEKAGISTITLSGIPDLTASVNVPRLAGIEYPLGYVLGRPGDRIGQMDVLRTTLEALFDIQKPGGVVHLPFEWPASARRLNAHPPQAPPISRYLIRHPWQIPNLMSRNVPSSKQRKKARKQADELVG